MSVDVVVGGGIDGASAIAPSIRALWSSDVPAVCALAREIWLIHYPGIISGEQIEYMLTQRYAPARLMAELSDAAISWRLAFRGSSLLAFASTHHYAASGELKLDKLYVHPDSQRQGLGGALIDDALRRADELGCERLTLAVNRHNSQAISAYRRRGFAVMRESVTDIGGGFRMDDFIMSCPVALPAKPGARGIDEA